MPLDFPRLAQGWPHFPESQAHSGMLDGMSAEPHLADAQDPDLRVAAKNIDAALLGRRIRHARQRSGLTQGQAAGEDMSTAYISRIEAGQRRPGIHLLVRLATRLGTTAGELLAPDESAACVDPELVARATLELDYAELSLRTGDAHAALARLKSIEIDGDVPVDVRRRASYLHALALEGTGPVDRAVLALEDVLAHDDDPTRLLRACMVLCRIHRDAGDYARAVEIGDRAATLVDQGALRGTPEGLQLVLTVASAYHERGDVDHAARLCLRAVDDADELGSPRALASAYWNSSIIEMERGHVEEALPMARKAIALLEVGEDARSQARLRSQLGILLLRQNPPQPEDALVHLRSAEQEMAWSHATSVDLHRNMLGMARARYLLGDLDVARGMAEECRDQIADDSPLLGAEAEVLLGRIATAESRVDDAVSQFRSAITRLSMIGSDRGVAELWFELGSLLQEHGLVQEAIDAFRRAAVSTGVGVRVPQPQTSSALLSR